MNEVTYEDWQKNPTPRMMWVWNSSENNKEQQKVIYITAKETFPVITVETDDTQPQFYRFCAEIEKQRRMTNKELSRWIREKLTREWKYKDGISVYCYCGYEEKRENEEVPDNVLIREDDGEWREPLVEVEE